MTKEINSKLIKNTSVNSQNDYNTEFCVEYVDGHKELHKVKNKSYVYYLYERFKK